MAHKKIPMEHDKKIALVAHDNKKRDLVEWAKFNRDLLAHHQVFATGTTGKILEHELGFKIVREGKHTIFARGKAWIGLPPYGCPSEIELEISACQKHHPSSNAASVVFQQCWLCGSGHLPPRRKCRCAR